MLSESFLLFSRVETITITFFFQADLSWAVFSKLNTLITSKLHLLHFSHMSTLNVPQLFLFIVIAFAATTRKNIFTQV